MARVLPYICNTLRAHYSPHAHHFFSLCYVSFPSALDDFVFLALSFRHSHLYGGGLLAWVYVRTYIGYFNARSFLINNPPAVCCSPIICALSNQIGGLSSSSVILALIENFVLSLCILVHPHTRAYTHTHQHASCSLLAIPVAPRPTRIHTITHMHPCLREH